MIEWCSFYGGVEVGAACGHGKKGRHTRDSSPSETDNPCSKSVKLDGKTDG